MENLKHTQGNWSKGTKTNTKEWMQIFCNCKVIAEAKELSKKGERKQTDFEEEEANAKLISAAPDLLNALALAYAFMVTDPQHQGRNILETMKQAINKAIN